MTQKGRAEFPVWRQLDGAPVSCLEKIKVLNENLAEIEEQSQDALEDAVLMGCDENQVREVMHAMVDRLVNPYAERMRKQGGRGR